MGETAAAAARRQSSSQEETTTFSCTYPKCKYAAKRRGDLKRHLADIHDEGVVWYACSRPNCQYSTKRKGNLKRHLVLMHCEVETNDKGPDIPLYNVMGYKNAPETRARTANENAELYERECQLAIRRREVFAHRQRYLAGHGHVGSHFTGRGAYVGAIAGRQPEMYDNQAAAMECMLMGDQAMWAEYQKRGLALDRQHGKHLAEMHMTAMYRGTSGHPDMQCAPTTAAGVDPVFRMRNEQERLDRDRRGNPPTFVEMDHYRDRRHAGVSESEASMPLAGDGGHLTTTGLTHRGLENHNKKMTRRCYEPLQSRVAKVFADVTRCVEMQLMGHGSSGSWRSSEDNDSDTTTILTSSHQSDIVLHPN